MYHWIIFKVASERHHGNALSAVRSPRFSVSGYGTKWRIQGCFDSSYSRSFNVKTWPRNSILRLVTYRYVCWMHLSQHKLCTRKTELALEVISTLLSYTTADRWKWRLRPISTVSVWAGRKLCMEASYNIPWRGGGGKQVGTGGLTGR